VKIDTRTSLEALGLERNPFGEAVDEFFAEGDRGRHLDELRHLARWSRRLLAVTGERGVGKSTLYRALSKRLDPGVKAARINANLTSDTREVLAGIIQGFGMAAPANADPRLLIALISLHVREQIDANRYCLVLVDDAHLLELRALEQLMKLVETGTREGLRIVFFAEAYFVQSLDKSSKRSEQADNWHEIRLSPFTDQESRRYVEFRLAAAGHRGRSPFTPNQISVIVGGSSGLPGRIDELASAILTGELRINDERGVLPRMHRALAVLVIIAAGMGWLIFYGYSGSSDSTADKHSDTVATQPQAVEPSVGVNDAEPVVSGETASLALAVPSQAPNASNEPPASHAPTAPSLEYADTKVTDSSATTPSAPAQPPNAPSVKADARKPATPVPRKPATPVLAQPEHDLAVAAPPSAAVGRTQTAQWLRQQPAKYFTLQLFATKSREKRDAFVNQQEHPDRFATFETTRNGEPWFAVTYGVYATQADAKAAAAGLPANVGVEPWIRSIGSVQAAIE
jgi:DamX protein